MRLKNSFRTSETQALAAAGMTLLNLIACAGRKEAPLWLWIFAVTFWPSVAWVGNLISPIRRGTPNKQQDTPGSGTRWRCRLCGRVMCMAKGAHSQPHKCVGGYRKRFGKAARQRGWDNCFERWHGDDPITVTAPCRPCGTDSAASTPELEPGECNHSGQSAGGCDRAAVLPNK